MNAEPVVPGQSFAADAFRPEDAAGIVNLFRVVYGEAYPLARYYDPDWITRANADGELISVVSRTPSGDIVAHSALYRSSPANPGLLELGLGLTLPEYRSTVAMLGITLYFRDTLVPGLTCDGIFGEAVCNHVITQKLCSFMGMHECTLEIDLMPAESYQAEQSAAGRVSCLSLFREITDQQHPLFLPDTCAGFLQELFPLVKITRGLAPADASPRVDVTELQTTFFDFAAVSRCNLIRVGDDYVAALTAMEEDARSKGRQISQVYVNLADPANGVAVAWLQAQGYFPGGLMPCWFVAGDALLLQKLEQAPGFDRVNLQSKRAKQLLELVQREYRS
jgi:hypothetical protein